MGVHPLKTGAMPSKFCQKCFTINLINDEETHGYR